MGSNVDNATSLALYVATLQTFTSHNASESIRIGMNGSHPVIPVSSSATPSMDTVVLLSIVFIIICSVGIFGNILVITAVLIDDKMRKCVTNFFIINLAVADIFIMILGIPEIGQFVLSRGWLLGPVACKVNRFLLVSSLYCSVWSLLAVSVERFVAIVFPIKAHIVCTRKKILCVIAFIWPVAIGCGLPTLLFNQVKPVAPGLSLCQIIFPGNNFQFFIIFKYLESVLFYFLPMVIQIVLYAVIGRRLYASTEELNTRFQMRPDAHSKTERSADTIKARKGVVKMLIASVLIYFISYSPQQIHLLYNTFSRTPFPQSWPFLVFVMIITHVNSAANPVLYSIFSQNFRRNFKRCLCFICYRMERKAYRRTRFDSFDSRAVSRRNSTSRTTMSRV
ncbi:neuropeptide receptor 15-like isoform X2 [Haliotis cracherodii]|uniref:neuropeptide receptor 15-like isoform X2 n=1 Tax=Haliotis cracherodii TaxID=6455 RepID=UPI0039EA9F66